MAETVYKPKIEHFEAWRANSSGVRADDGSYVRAKIRLSLASSSYLSGATLTLRYGTTPGSLTSARVLSATSAMLSSAQTIAVSGSFPASMTYYLQLVFSRGGETAQSAVLALPRAFATIHYSPCSTGGVAIGGFSSAKEGVPKFEVHHPSYLYGNIAQIGSASNPWTTLSPASGVTVDSTYNAPLQYRVIEKHVFIRGIVRVSGGSSAVKLATLPENLQPEYAHFQLAACEGARLARIVVDPNEGDGRSLRLSANWPRALSNGAAVTDSVWVDCTMDYWLNSL